MVELQTSKRVNTRTLNNEFIILDFIDKNGKPPTLKQIMDITDIKNEANASFLLKKSREVFKERLERKLDAVSDKLIERLRERVDDRDDPMHDENLIKLLEFCFPKKVETKNYMENTVNVRAVDELKDELANYGKLIPTGDNAPTL